MRRIFAFTTKRQNRNSVQHLFCRGLLQRRCALQQRGASPIFFSGNYIQQLASPHHSSKLCLWVSVLYLDLFVAAINTMCPNLIFCLPYVISPQQCFTETLSDGRGHLHYFLFICYLLFVPKSSGNFSLCHECRLLLWTFHCTRLIL